MEESVTERARRLVRMADAIEDSSRRQQMERKSLHLDDEEEEGSYRTSDSSSRQRSSWSRQETYSDDESMDLNELLGVESSEQEQEEKSSTFLDQPSEQSAESAQGMENASAANTASETSPRPQVDGKPCKEQQRRNALNNLFSRAASGLDAEEVDKHQSFWFIQKSGKGNALMESHTSLESSSKPELLQKYKDVQNALLSMRENARLRYQRLEMEHIRLQENHTAARYKIEELQMQLQDMEQTNKSLEGHLKDHHGKDIAAILQHMTDNQVQLERKLHQAQLEREQAALEIKELRSKMDTCSTCRQDDEETKDPSSVSTTKSWWMGAAKMFALDKEAEATVVPPSSSKSIADSEKTQEKPPLAKQGSNVVEEGIENLKKRMDEELESLKDEWSSAHSRPPSPVREEDPVPDVVPSTPPPRAETKKKKKKPKRKKTLESLFSMTVSLNDEELDDTQSFWSLPRSVKSSPGTRSSNKSRHRKQKTKTTTDEHWEHFTGSAPSSSTSETRSALRKFLALPSPELFMKQRDSASTLTTSRVDEQPAQTSMVPRMEQVEEPVMEELLASSRWNTSDESDPLGFIGKEVTAWRGTTIVNS